MFVCMLDRDIRYRSIVASSLRDASTLITRSKRIDRRVIALTIRAMAVRWWWRGDPRTDVPLSASEQTQSPDYEIRTSDGAIGLLASAEVNKARAAEYEVWKKATAEKRPKGHETVVTQARPVHWTPLKKALSECTIALVSTGGVHLKTQEPYDVDAPVGDWTSRRIPGDVDTSELTFTHTHYTTDDAIVDPNVMFPLDRLRELTADRIVGRVSPVHFGFMGFIPDPALLMSETVSAAAQELKESGVDAVVLTAG